RARCRSRASRARILAKIHFFHRPQGDRNSVRALWNGVPLLWLLPDDDDALAPGLSWAGDAGDRQMAAIHLRSRFDAGRKDDAGFLQLIGRDARNDHDFFGRGAAGVRSFRKLCRATANWRAGYDISESERRELLGVRGWRIDHADQFLCAWRRGQGWLDFLHAAGGVR